MTTIIIAGRPRTLLEWMQSEMYDAYQDCHLADDADRFVRIVERVQHAIDVDPHEVGAYIDAFDDPGHAEWIATASIDEIGGWIVDGLR